MGIQSTLGSIANQALLNVAPSLAPPPDVAGRPAWEPTGFAPDLPYNAQASALQAGIGAIGPKRYDASDLYGPNGPQETDIQQKSIGDCYFDATMGVVAQRNPSQIENAIHYDANSGNFVVTFYEKGPFGIPLPRQVAVTQADIQDNIQRGGSSTAGSGGPVWPAVMEAAFAKMHLQDASANGATPDPRIDGGYGPGGGDRLGPDGKPINQLDANGKPIPVLDENGKQKLGADGKPLYQHEQVTIGGIGGGWGRDALYTLTGETADTMQPPGNGNGWFDHLLTQFSGSRLQSALNHGATVTFSTGADPKGQPQDGLVGDHVYMVNRVYQDANGTWQVELRNPWGNNGNDGKGHGIEGVGNGGAVITVPLTSMHADSEGFVISPTQ